MSPRRPLKPVLALALCALLPVDARAGANRTDVFALDRSFYPSHVYLGGSVPSNHGVDHLIGSLHLSSFDELGRHPDHGWLQAAVWEPAFDVLRPDGTHRHRTALITTAYVVSEYDSPAAAHNAVEDLHAAKGAWKRLGDGPDGRMVEQKANGYTVLEAAFSQGAFDVEDLTMVGPDTPQVFQRTIRAAILRQLATLERISAGLGRRIVSRLRWISSSPVMGSSARQSALHPRTVPAR